MIFKASPFLHIIPLDKNHFAFYNSLNLEVAYLERKFIEHCSQGEKFVSFDTESVSILKSLAEMELLIPEDSDGLKTYNSYKNALENPSINILYLLLTDACNLRCEYCYFLAGMGQEYNFSFMSETTALRAIDMFARCVKKGIADGYDGQQIVIYGGEATLNKKTLLAVLKYIMSAKQQGLLPQHISTIINTNGIALDDEILSEAKKNNALVSISIDGPPEIHDKLRVYPDGKPSFNDVVKSYRLAKEKEVRTGLCCTVDEHNLENLPKIITWLSDNLDVRDMGFNILIQNKRYQNEIEHTKYSEKIAKALIDCFLIAREKGIYEDRMMRRVKNFIEKTPVSSDCGGCGLQIVVAPEGQIGVCQAFCGSKEYFVSESFELFEPVKHPYWKEWRKRSPLLMDECRSCIALGNCGGGCPYNAYKRKGTIWERDERFCVHAKTAVNFLIKDLWENSIKKSAQDKET